MTPADRIIAAIVASCDYGAEKAALGPGEAERATLDYLRGMLGVIAEDYTPAGNASDALGKLHNTQQK